MALVEEVGLAAEGAGSPAPLSLPALAAGLLQQNLGTPEEMLTPNSKLQ